MVMITGKYLKQLREEAGISQTELAKLVGVSQAHIAKIENEKVDPRLSTVNKILLALTSREHVLKKCRDVMKKRLIVAKPHDSVRKIISIMRRFSISQIPVIYKGKLMGSIRESTIIKHMDRPLNVMQVKDIMDEPFPVISGEEPIDILAPLLDFHQAVLVSEKGRIVGIITKSDLIKISGNEK